MKVSLKFRFSFVYTDFNQKLLLSSTPPVAGWTHKRGIRLTGSRELWELRTKGLDPTSQLR